MNKPIRILQVVTIMDLGGIENFLMNLYRNIDRSIIQFDFLVHRQKEGVFEKEIKELGGNIYRLKPMKPLRFLSYQSELKFFFKHNSQFSIIHSHINANSTLILAAAKRAGIPVRIAHSHASISANKYKILRDLLLKNLTKYSTHNIACSKAAGQWLFKKQPFLLINNCIDSNKFKFNDHFRQQFREHLNINENDVVIGNIASFTEVKNHVFLINVFAQYHVRNPNSKLILIGEGPFKDRILKQIQDLGLNDNIILTGSIQNPQDYLNAMDFYLFTSFFEGLGISIVEAQCNGLPSLISDSIPKDVILTDLVHQESLSNLELNWVQRLEDILLFNKNNDRETYYEFIREKGYDVKLNVKKMQDLYLKELTENHM